MRNKAIFLIICSLFFSFFILTERYSVTLLVPLFVVFIFSTEGNVKFIILSLVALFPFTIGHFAGKEVIAIEIIAPLVFIYMLYDTAKNKNSLFPKRVKLFLVVLFVFLISVIIHYLSRPVSAEILGATSEYNRGLRNYYIIISGIFVYFASLWFFAYTGFKDEPWLKMVIIISIALGLLRLLSYSLNFQIPFIWGSFRYAENPSTHFGGITHRIGGLDTVGIIGFAALVAYSHKKNIKFFEILTFIFLFAILVSGGGRTAFWGLMFSFILYILFIAKRASVRIAGSVIFIILLYCFFSILLNLPNQFERLLAISPNIAERDIYRGETFKFYWHFFTESPLFGKGIGFVSVNTPHKEFVLRQLKAGGHCAYLSVLAIFGMIGGVFLGTFLFGTIFAGYKILKRLSTSEKGLKQEKLIVFSLFYLTTISVYYLTGLSGYDDMVLFLVSGLVGGLAVQSLRNNTIRNR